VVANAPIAGLVLAGGQSTRMQRDKATLLVDGETQLARAIRLITPYVTHSYVSVRTDQTNEPERARFPQIIDQLSGLGPAAGILAAQQTRPDHAWLVVAIDLPLLDQDTLAHLVAHRDPSQLATAFKSSSDGLPEPLCAIWEPSSHVALAQFLQQGRSCPRKFLLNHAVSLIDLPSTDALHNVNTPAEYAALGQRTVSTHP